MELLHYMNRVNDEVNGEAEYFDEQGSTEVEYLPALVAYSNNGSFVALYYNDNQQLTLEAYDAIHNESRFVFPRKEEAEVAYKFAALYEYVSS